MVEYKFKFEASSASFLPDTKGDANSETTGLSPANSPESVQIIHTTYDLPLNGKYIVARPEIQQYGSKAGGVKGGVH